MFPFLKCSFKKTLNIPKLSGGVNLRDSVSLIGDNQLTDCKNMWFMDGMLRTRPRVNSNTKQDNLTVITAQGSGYTEVCPKHEINREVVTLINGQRYVLSILSCQFKGGAQPPKLIVCLKFINEQDVADKISVGQFELQMGEASLLTFQQGGDIYCFVSGDGETKVVKIKCKNEAQYDRAQILADNEIYTPTVYTDCKMTGSLMALDEEFEDITFSKAEFSGNKLKGINLLSDYYKCVYSTVNKSLFVNGITKVPMEYVIPHELTKDMAGKTVTAKITCPNGMVAVHTVTLLSNGQGYEETANKIDGLLMSARGQKIYFEAEWDEEYTVEKYLTADDYIKNDMELILPCPNSATNRKRVLCMTKAMRYGGDTHGLFGGSHIILGGNTQRNETALVVWNDPAEPLYFSQDNCTYVGDKQEPVTAFGRQGESLVIFKDRELFVAESLNKAEASTVSIKQVHGYIGCDCPDTVELCRNRLVWTNSDGKVYTLVSKNQYDERALFVVSQMIDGKLGQEVDLKSAHSADYNGHYILLVGNRMYVMDYNSYGYNRVSSQTKNEDANLHIPWYYWELPITPACSYATPQLLLFSVITTNEAEKSIAANMCFLDGTTGADSLALPHFDGGWTLHSETQNIKSGFKTKLFDFDLPSSSKAVDRVMLSFGTVCDATVSVSFVSEQQVSDSHIVSLLGDRATQNGNLYSCSLFPYTASALRFGVALESEQPIAVNSLSLQYKSLKLI